MGEICEGFLEMENFLEFMLALVIIQHGVPGRNFTGNEVEGQI